MTKTAHRDRRLRVFEIGVRQSHGIEAVQRTVAPPVGPGEHAIGPGRCDVCGARCMWGSGRWWHQTADGGWGPCPGRA